MARSYTLAYAPSVFTTAPFDYEPAATGSLYLRGGVGLGGSLAARSRARVSLSGGVGIGGSVSVRQRSRVSISGGVGLGGSVTLLALGKMAVFGDSITVGVAASAAEYRWANLVQSSFGYATLTNAGISGTVLQNSPDSTSSPRADNGRDRFSAALLGANKADLLISQYGFNDLRYTGAPSTFNLTQFINDYREILNGLRLGGYTTSQIILNSPPWGPDALYSTGSAGFTGSNRTVHEQYVTAVSDLAFEYGVRFTNVYAYMRDNGGVSLMSGDDVHPNNAGHAAIANAVTTTAAYLNSNTAPGSLSLTSPADGTLLFSWSSLGGSVTSYTVEVGISGSYTFATTASESTASKTFTGLAGGSYVGRVRANYASGQSSPWSFFSTPVSVAAGGFAPVIDDISTFSAGNLGSPYTRLSAGNTDADAVVTSAGRLRITSTANKMLYYSRGEVAFPATGGVYALARIYVFTNPASGVQSIGVGLRMGETAANGYYAVYNGQTTRLFRYNAGTLTVVATHTAALAASNQHTIRLEVDQSNQRVIVNGTTVINTAEALSALTSPGIDFGLRFQTSPSPGTVSDTTGFQFERIEYGIL